MKCKRIGELFYANILDTAIQKCLQNRNKMKVQKKHELSEYILTKDEEETVRYVVGYIIFSLKKSLKGKKLIDAVAVREVLTC